MTYWHGGGRIAGDYVEDAAGAGRSGDSGVFVTSVRSLAETYAATTDGASAWVYEVEPIGTLNPIPSLVGTETISFRCERARIVRRFTLSNARRREMREAVSIGFQAMAEDRGFQGSSTGDGEDGTERPVPSPWDPHGREGGS